MKYNKWFIACLGLLAVIIVPGNLGMILGFLFSGILLADAS